jgi:hypothetical protein
MSSENNNSSSAGGIGFTGILTIVFIVLKLTGVIQWSWLWVLSPIWITALTADSVKSNGDNRWVRIVLPSGYFYVSSCHGVSGVRPVCIFSSLIFESEE